MSRFATVLRREGDDTDFYQVSNRTNNRVQDRIDLLKSAITETFGEDIGRRAENIIEDLNDATVPEADGDGSESSSNQN